MNKMDISPNVPTCSGSCLKYGTIAIAVFQSILSFLFLVVSATFAEYSDEVKAKLTDDPSAVAGMTVVRCTFIIIAVFNSFLFIASSILIFGAITNRPLLFLPWFILNIITIIIYAIIKVLLIIAYAQTNDHKTEYTSIIGYLIMVLTIILIHSLMILVVHRFYRFLKSLMCET